MLTPTPTPTPTSASASTPRSNHPHADEQRTPSSGYLPALRSPVVEDTLSDIEEALSEISKNRQSRTSKVMRDHNRRHSGASIPSPPTAAAAAAVGSSNPLPVTEEISDSSSECNVAAHNRRPLEHMTDRLMGWPDSTHEPSTAIYDSEDEVQDEAQHDRDHAIDDDDDDERGRPSVLSSSLDYSTDDVPYTRADILKWTPADVSQYLQSRQISPAVCIKFEEQEVTGSILLQLEMAHLKELELGSFGKRFEVWKEIEHLAKNLKHPATKPRSGSDAAARRSATGLGPAPSGHGRQRSSTVGAVLPRILSQHNRPASRQPQHQYQHQQHQHHQHHQHQHMADVPEADHQDYHYSGSSSSLKNSVSSEVSPPASPGIWEQPRSLPLSSKRRSHSTHHHPHPHYHPHPHHHQSPATALNAAMSAGAAVLACSGVEDKTSLHQQQPEQPQPQHPRPGPSPSQHQREKSFDRGWASGLIAGLTRPSSATGMRETKGKHKLSSSNATADSAFTADSGFAGSTTHSPAVPQSAATTERCYFSSGEAAPKERKLLQKTNGGAKTTPASDSSSGVWKWWWKW